MLDNELQLFEQDDYVKHLLKYPMLKLADDISKKYKVKSINPCYHWLMSNDGKMALTGYQIEFNNGLILSVQFGGGHYASNRDKRLSMTFNISNQFSFLEISDTAEIAILKNDVLVHIDEWQDSVLGYQSPDEIMQVIDKYIMGNLLDES